MKNLIWIFIFLGIILLSSCGGNREISNFYHKHKRKDDVVNFTVPGWLIWFGTGIYNESAKDPEVKAGLAIAKKVKRIRFMVAEGGNPIPEEDVKKLIENVRKSNFEDLIYVKDGETNFTLMVKEKKEKIKSMLMLAREEDEFVLFHLKSNLKYKDIGKLIKTFSKDMKIEKPIKKPTPQA